MRSNEVRTGFESVPGLTKLTNCLEKESGGVRNSLRHILNDSMRTFDRIRKRGYTRSMGVRQWEDRPMPDLIVAPVLRGRARLIIY